MNKVTAKNYIILHLNLIIYCFGSIFSKLASKNQFLSIKFIFYYGLVLLTLVIYALLWQQVIKNMSLTTAFANKSIVVIWGMIFGNLLFDEKITIKMIIGGIIIFIGIYLVVTDNE